MTYAICPRCIMNITHEPDISNGNVLCDYCENFDNQIKPNWHQGADADKFLIDMAKTIKQSSPLEKYNCIIGLSGGLDSSYVAYIAKEKMGLRPLLFHVDAGWNTNQAVSNIEKIVDGLGLDLYTKVIDWEAVKRMQVAFLRSGIPDQDLVQDACFFSELYKFARLNGIRHIITGSNFSTECCREPEEWGGYLGIDKTLFNDIWLKCGDGKSIKFNLIDIFVYKIWYQKILGMKVHHPLNFVTYRKKDAEDQLKNLFGWQPFKHKHHESRFTRFYEDYWLPRRFNFDKRRAHFSSLIMTNQMSRREALDRIAKPELDQHFIRQEFEYVARKLDLTNQELTLLFYSPQKTFHDYKNKRNFIHIGAKLMRIFGSEKRFFK